MPTDELNVLKQPACRHLLCKGMYVTGQMNLDMDDEQMGDDHCWCNKTQNAIGPDDGLVERRACTPSRQCYDGLV